MSIIAVIPARGGSKRLPRKNIYPVFDRPMIAWAIETCQRSTHIDRVFVSTEDAEIASIAREYGAVVIDRPDTLASDEMPKMEVVRHADTWYQRQYNQVPDILVSVQANSPEINVSDIDMGIELLKEKNLYEVISVGKDMVQNASFRVIKQNCLHNTFLSAHLGVVINECLDVHTLDDVIRIESQYESVTQFEQKIGA